MKSIVLGVIVMLASATAFAGYKIGDEPADFRLQNVDSAFVSLKDFVSFRGVMVVFTSNDCPQALNYEDRILDLARKISLAGWKTIAINSCTEANGPDENFAGNQKRAEDKTYEFPYLYDDKQVVAHAFGVAYVPTVYLLRSTGTSYEVQYIGTIDDAPDPSMKVHNQYVEWAIEALNAGTTPETQRTKPKGCDIKWK